LGALVGASATAGISVFTWEGDTSTNPTDVTNWLDNNKPAGNGLSLEDIKFNSNSSGSLMLPGPGLALHSLLFDATHATDFTLSGAAIFTLSGDVTVLGTGNLSLVGSVVLKLTDDGNDNTHTIHIANATTKV